MKSDNKRQVISRLPELGKVPPQANDMEEAVLGIIMVDLYSMNDIIDLLTPESFYREAHQKIFNAAVTVFKKSGSCDMFTISEYLRANNEIDSVGGPVYLAGLTGKVVSSAMIVNYALIIKQKYIQRELIRVSTELQTRSFDDSNDISDLLGYAETSLLEISGRIFRNQAQKLGAILDNVVDNIAKVISGEIKLIGVPSGFTSLDRYTAGFKRKELTILAGRPSMGKTALAVQFAKNIAMLGTPTGFFSCEMSKEELAIRYLSGESGKSNNEIINGKCGIDILCRASEALQGLPLYIDDTAAISLIEIRAKARRMIIQHGVKIIFVDYLQLMTGEGKTREQEVAFISRGLKAIAKDLEIPIIALSQLNRAIEGRSDKKPMLSDLRESGAIEQDADIVMFLHRPEKYGAVDYDIDGKNVDARGLMIPIISKNRNGPVGELVFRCNQFLTHIYEEDSILEFKASINKLDEEPPFAQN